MKHTSTSGYTLIELMVSIGLFATIMMLASGAYLVMIGISQQTQSIATGIDNLAFALETMTRTIRTGTNYSCTIDSSTGNDCSGGMSFFVTTSGGSRVSYTLSGNAITQDNVPLTDPSVTITSLLFNASGTTRGDDSQSRVTITISGSIPSGHGNTEYFTIETGATMRGIDI